MEVSLELLKQMPILFLAGAANTDLAYAVAHGMFIVGGNEVDMVVAQNNS